MVWRLLLRMKNLHKNHIKAQQLEHYLIFDLSFRISNVLFKWISIVVIPVNSNAVTACHCTLYWSDSHLLIWWQKIFSILFYSILQQWKYIGASKTRDDAWKCIWKTNCTYPSSIQSVESLFVTWLVEIGGELPCNRPGDFSLMDSRNGCLLCGLTFCPGVRSPAERSHRGGNTVKALDGKSQIWYTTVNEISKKICLPTCDCGCMLNCCAASRQTLPSSTLLPSDPLWVWSFSLPLLGMT